MNNNKLIIAAAGSGKTTHLVNEALKIKDKKVLITTYTDANEAEIRKKIIELNKCIPENVTVQTWFSFLLKHGARPFQGVLFEKKIKGMFLVKSQSGIRYYTKPCADCKQIKIVNPECRKCKNPVYYAEDKNFKQHYFTKEVKIYSDKLSKFVVRCNENTKGNVIDRISKIYQYIFIDEVQDLAGYDLELLKLLFNCNSNILLVGDPRQGTYSTNSALKNKQFRKAKIINFFTDKINDLTKDDDSLIINYRCINPICELSNKLFPTMRQTTSGNNNTTGHDGIFFVKKQDVEEYLRQYQPLQLRDSKRTNVNENYRVMNFGESKGLSFDRVLIYPTDKILKWLKNNTSDFPDTSRSKFYVAITRARYSVGIIVENNEQAVIEGITYFANQTTQ
jgi:superfamily I DNA/RNA helicase